MLAKGLTEFWHTAVQHRVSYRDANPEDMVGAKICYADTCIFVTNVNILTNEIHYTVMSRNIPITKIVERRTQEGIVFHGQDVLLGRFEGDAHSVSLPTTGPSESTANPDGTITYPNRHNVSVEDMLYRAKRTQKFNGLELYLLLVEADKWAKDYSSGAIRDIDAFLTSQR